MWRYNLKYHGWKYVLRYDLVGWFLIPYYNTKYFIQRGKRGWSDSDTWNLDGHLYDILSEALIYIANTTDGHPCRGENVPEDCNNCKCGELWDKELRENAERFRLLSEDNWHEIEPIEKALEEEEETYNEAMEWLAKWMRGLWT